MSYPVLYIHPAAVLVPVALMPTSRSTDNCSSPKASREAPYWHSPTLFVGQVSGVALRHILKIRLKLDYIYSAAAPVPTLGVADPGKSNSERENSIGNTKKCDNSVKVAHKGDPLLDRMKKNTFKEAALSLAIEDSLVDLFTKILKSGLPKESLK